MSPSVEVTAADPTAYDATVRELVADGVASRLGRQDPTLWGPDAEDEASRRLAWVGLPETSRPLVEQVTSLREELAGRGLDRVVLCGMGGSSLAPEVICASHGVPLVVVDSSHPDFVRAATAERLEATVVVVSSKSGGTVETDSQLRAFEQAFADAGLEAAGRIVVVTDPGSPLAEQATGKGYRVFEADPDVGGRYSALTAFGLVPSGLAGADIAALLDEAAGAREALEADSADNPALRLGGLLAAGALAGSDKVVLADGGSSHPGLGDWVEQLLAESTGKGGVGLLPLVVEDAGAPDVTDPAPDSVLVTYGPRSDADGGSAWSAAVDAPLGAQLLLWEHATAVAGRVMAINPFDQPDVESAKAAAREMLEGTAPAARPAFTEGEVAVHPSGSWLPDRVDSVAGAVASLLDQVVPDRGYLAVHAYLDRHRDTRLAEVRQPLARHLGRPVTFGWGPRFLHSTGQYHKGGPPTGAFLQVTGAIEEDLPVPGRDFTFGEFITAQAVGDATVLAEEHDRPVLRLHLATPAAVDAVLAAVREALG